MPDARQVVYGIHTTSTRLVQVGSTTETEEPPHCGG